MKKLSYIKIGVVNDSGLGWGATEIIKVPNRLIRGREDLLAVYLAKYLSEHLESVLMEEK